MFFIDLILIFDADTLYVQNYKQNILQILLNFRL